MGATVAWAVVDVAWGVVRAQTESGLNFKGPSSNTAASGAEGSLAPSPPAPQISISRISPARSLGSLPPPSLHTSLTEYVPRIFSGLLTRFHTCWLHVNAFDDPNSPTHRERQPPVLHPHRLCIPHLNVSVPKQYSIYHLACTLQRQADPLSSLRNHPPVQLTHLPRPYPAPRDCLLHRQ